jgi:hypothetical protein
MSNPGTLEPGEYERRRVFLEQLKGLTKPEYIEIVRILQKHEVAFSENANGIFFNITLLGQEVFDALVKFLEFTQSNRRDLAARELEMNTLAKEMGILSEKVKA